MKSSNLSIGVSPHEMLPKVHKMLRKLAWSASAKYHMDYDECLSEAYAIFLNACKKFDPNRDASFSTWCYYRVSLNLRSFAMAKAKRAERFVHYEQLAKAYGESAGVEFDPAYLEQLQDELHVEPVNPISDLLSGLSEDAKEIVQMLLETPAEIINLVKRRKRAVRPQELLNHVCWKVEKRRGTERVETALLELNARFGPVLTAV